MDKQPKFKIGDKVISHKGIAKVVNISIPYNGSGFLYELNTLTYRPLPFFQFEQYLVKYEG